MSYRGYQVLGLEKQKLRPCIICKSRRWHREGGILVCESGHNYQGYIEEDLESFTHSRVRRRGRRVSRTVVEKVQKIHGPRGYYHFVRCLQYMLQLEIDALISDFGAPKELDCVVKEIWLLLISKLNLKYSAGDNDEESEDISSDSDLGFSAEEDGNRDGERTMSAGGNEGNQQMRTVSGTQKRVREDTGRDSEQDNDTDELDHSVRTLQSRMADEEREEIEEVKLGEVGESSDNVIKYRHTTESQRNGRSRPTRQKQRQRRPRKPDDRYLSFLNAAPHSSDLDWRGPGNYKQKLKVAIPDVHWLPVLCYLGLAWLRYPVVIGEFYRLVQEERIPFFTAYRRLPRRWRQQCNALQYSKLRPNFCKGPDHARKTVGMLVHMLDAEYGVRFPEGNFPLLLHFLVRRLGIPIEFYTLAQRIANHLNIITTYAIRSHTSQINQYLPEANAAAIIIIALKLQYGFDDTNRDSNYKVLPGFPSSFEFLEKWRANFECEISAALWCELGLTTKSKQGEFVRFCQRYLHYDPSHRTRNKRDKVAGTFNDIAAGYLGWNSRLSRPYSGETNRLGRYSQSQDQYLNTLNPLPPSYIGSGFSFSLEPLLSGAIFDHSSEQVDQDQGLDSQSFAGVQNGTAGFPKSKPTIAGSSAAVPLPGSSYVVYNTTTRTEAAGNFHSEFSFILVRLALLVGCKPEQLAMLIGIYEHDLIKDLEVIKLFTN